MLMPCNVIVYETDDGKTTVSAVDPMQTLAAQGDPEMKPLAEAVQEGSRFFEGSGMGRSLEHRNAAALGQRPCPRLVTEELQGLWRRPHEGQPGRFACAREPRLLRQAASSQSVEERPRDVYTSSERIAKSATVPN